MKGYWGLWLIPSIVLLIMGLVNCNIYPLWLIIVIVSAASLLAGIGCSQRFAGYVKWWILLIAYIGMRLLISITLVLNGTRELALILEFVATTILVCIIGILIVNCYRSHKLKMGNKEIVDKDFDKYTKILDEDPKDAGAYYNRGVAYHLKGDYSNAIADYTEAINLNPKYTAAYYSRGNAYESMGDHYRAEADKEMAKEVGI